MAPQVYVLSRGVNDKGYFPFNFRLTEHKPFGL